MKKPIDVIISDMNEGDIPQLVEIESASFSKAWTKEGFEAELDSDTANFLTARLGDRIVGYIGFYAVLDEGYTANIAVLPEFRRMGVADTLMQAALDRARQLELSFLSLEVRKSNEAAISLYKKYGFEKVGERRRFYSAPTEDAFIMTHYFK